MCCESREDSTHTLGTLRRSEDIQDGKGKEVNIDDLKSLQSVGKTLDKITPGGMRTLERQDITLEQKWNLICESDQDALLNAFERASEGIRLIRDAVDLAIATKGETNENA